MEIVTTLILEIQVTKIGAIMVITIMDIHSSTILGTNGLSLLVWLQLIYGKSLLSTQMAIWCSKSSKTRTIFLIESNSAAVQ